MSRKIRNFPFSALAKSFVVRKVVPARLKSEPLNFRGWGKMLSPRRNSLCPCKSGLRHKHCHGRPFGNIPKIENTALSYYNKQIRKHVFVTKDTLINQIYRDCKEISISFDKKIEGDLIGISSVFSDVYSLIIPILFRNVRGSLSSDLVCARIIGNALNTITSCVILLRNGYRAQSMTLVRSVIESTSTILELISKPDMLEKFLEGKYKSTSSVAYAQKVFPFFGEMYGMLSNNFVHIGKNFSDLDKIVPYNDDDISYDVSLGNIKVSLMMLYIVAELNSINESGEKKFWKIVNSGENTTEVKFNPSEEILNWQIRFFGSLD